MINRNDIEKERSPRGLRQFVRYRIEKVRKNRVERHSALRKRGIYKVFTDEIIPLSVFALKAYPSNFRIAPVLGNQAYDAVVKDETGAVVDHIELTWPHDGKKQYEDAERVVTRGYGDADVYSSGEDVDRLCTFIRATCEKKVLKDYSNCTLVIVINFNRPYPSDRRLYFARVARLAADIRGFPFKARRVYILLLPFHRIQKIG